MKLFGYNVDKYLDIKDEVEITENIFEIDGYHFGDRLLEGVMFDVTFKGNKVKSVKVQKDCEDYFEQLNEKYWLGVAKSFAQNLLDECDSDLISLPKDILKKYKVVDAYFKEDKPKKVKVVKPIVVVKKTNIKDLMSKHKK